MVTLAVRQREELREQAAAKERLKNGLFDVPELFFDKDTHLNNAESIFVSVRSKPSYIGGPEWRTWSIDLTGNTYFARQARESSVFKVLSDLLDIYSYRGASENVRIIVSNFSVPARMGKSKGYIGLTNVLPYPAEQSIVENALTMLLGDLGILRVAERLFESEQK